MKKINILKSTAYFSYIWFIMALSVPAYSNVVTSNSAYFGIDALYSSMKFKEDFGGNIISKKLAPGLNLFTGYMFNENFGVETGFEFYKKMKKTVNKIAEGVVVAGVQIPIDPANLGYWESYKTTISQRHPYFGVIAKTNITNKNSISLLVGLSLSHIKTQYTIFDDAGGEILRNGVIVRTFSSTKVVPMIRTTIEHKFNEKFGIRAVLSWKQTSLCKNKSKEVPFSMAEIKAKDTFTVGVGATYYMF